MRSGDSQRDPDGADEGDGSPEQAAEEPHRLADPVHRVQQLVLAKAEQRSSISGSYATQGPRSGVARAALRRGCTLSQVASGSRYLASLEESAWAPFCCCAGACARDCFADDLALAISLSLSGSRGGWNGGGIPEARRGGCGSRRRTCTGQFQIEARPQSREGGKGQLAGGGRRRSLPFPSFSTAAPPAAFGICVYAIMPLEEVKRDEPATRKWVFSLGHQVMHLMIADNHH